VSEQEKNTAPEQENSFDLPIDDVEETPVKSEPAEDYKEKYEHEHEAHLRLAAEYDNFRKRSQKEKEASYTNGKSDTLAKLLPVYDNLERAMNQETADAAYKKGVEMTMQGLVKIFTELGVEIYGNVGDEFDPNLHNAVMHTESEELGENVISQVFQKGFKIGEKVVRFAMVVVAN
jgi:molecular chaperone GrpE